MNIKEKKSKSFKNFKWKTALHQLFAATVNQQTLEEAAELMVFVSASDMSYHKEFIFTLNKAIHAGESGDTSIIACINKSGYQVSSLVEAIDILNDFRSIYIEEYLRQI